MSNNTPPMPGFWTRRLTDVYSATAAGLVGVGRTWYRLTGKWEGNGVDQRMGRALPDPAGDNPVWIHASSMGEVRVAGLFAHVLAAEGIPLVASAMTESGYHLIPAVFPKSTAAFRVPFDTPRPMRRTLSHFAPRALIIVETEWWPNLLLQSALAGVPVFLINGRLSERAYRRYRLGRAYWSRVLDAIRVFYMRSESDAERVRRLGVDPDRVRAVGTLKAVDPALLSGDIRIPEWADKGRGPLWIAGCTRPGEEEIILDAWSVVRRDIPDLRLWIAPRHPDRFETVAREIERPGRPLVRWSEHAAGGAMLPPDSVVLIDRMGILASLYRLADVSFIGGSLQPYGGHSPLEPALAGTPVTFGPHMDAQRDAADLLLSHGLAREVWGATSLAMSITEFLDSPVSASQRQERAARLLDNLNRTRAEVARDLISRLPAIPAR